MQKQNKTLKDIVVSLELAKELKGNGYRQESLYSWFNSNYTGNKKLDSWSVHLSNQPTGGLKNVCSAPTSNELTNNLPVHIVIKQQVFRLTIDIDKNRRFYINYLAYKNSNSRGSDCDLSVFEHDASIFGISEDAFYQTGLHIGGDESLPNALAKMYIYLKQEGLL